MNNLLIECCANNVQSAINGAKGGATRIELCENLPVGGMTPKHEDIIKAKEKLTIPLHILIRPREGSFIYNDDEFNQILTDIAFCKNIGCSGIVIGALKIDGSINKNQTKAMVDSAKPMHVTFHRAFDEGNNLAKNLEDVIACGCDTLLTAGQNNNVSHGMSNLKKLVSISEGRINILAGSGVCHENIKDLFKIGIRNFHLSGSEKNTDGILETNSKNILAVIKELNTIV